MYENKVVKKIPGEVLPLKKESQGYIDKLENKATIELRDILARQNKLIANKSFILKLPDHGEKIKKFRDKIKKEVEHRDDVERAANLLSRLNIVSEGKDAVNELEWTGKYHEKSLKIVELDMEEETDPLKILAQPTGTGVYKKKIINLQEEESLIKQEDLIEIESLKKEKLTLQHVNYIIDKVENPNYTESNKKQSFKPYKTTLSDVHDPMKEKIRKKHNWWEVTAATPPLIVHGPTKMLSLNESLKLQVEQSKKLKEIQTKHAIEQLSRHIGEHSAESLPINVGAYRSNDQDSNESNSETEENEVYDDEDDDKAGTIVFPADSIEI